MPSLASMRSVDPAGDPFQPLGPAVKPPAPAPAVPAGKPTGTPGVVQMPDGKLQTQLPLPPAVRVHDSFVFPSYTKDDFEHEFLQDFSTVEQPKSPSSETLRKVLAAVIQLPDYPADGTAWTEHDPAVGTYQPAARYVLLRCGEVRRADRIGTWGLSKPGCRIHPDYEVVGWK